MIRKLMIATAVLAGSTMGAFAAEKAGNADGRVYGKELANQYDAKQAHNILANRGFVNISALDRDENGRWAGMATKDGKTIFVAVVLPKPPAEGATN